MQPDYRDLRPAERGSDRHFAWQQSLGPNVRFESLADIGVRPRDVRFTPKSGHRNSVVECPLCAKSGHRSLTGRFSLRQELCRIPSIVKLMPSPLWLVCQ